MPDRPNVILISVDQWRGDCLSCEGHPVVHTPSLDSMFLSGTRFTRAYAATPSCIAARATLMTGLNQEHTGRVGYKDRVPWDYPVTMAGEFTKGGYQTHAVGKMHAWPVRNRLGFESVNLHDGYVHAYRNLEGDMEDNDDYLAWLRRNDRHDSDYFENALNCNAYNTRPWDKAEHLHPTNYIVSQSIDFMRTRDTTCPFFLYMSFHRPHPPLDPPQWAFDHYINADMPDVPVGDWADYFEPMHQPLSPTLPAGRMRPDLLKRTRAGYYGHLTHIDNQINRLRESLGELGLSGNTYICFVSDHGDLLGDHHLFRKKLPFEGSAHVPLIIKGPADSGIKSSHTSDAVVELRDIMPTLLDCAGLPIPDGLDGRSFLPLARGENAKWRDDLHGEHAGGSDASQWMTDGHEKYIWMPTDGREFLFNIDDDPQELRDLSAVPEMQHRMDHWRSRLIKTLASREEGFVQSGKLQSGTDTKPVLSFLAKRTGYE